VKYGLCEWQENHHDERWMDAQVNHEQLVENFLSIDVITAEARPNSL
jgi:hypothetical protein